MKNHVILNNQEGSGAPRSAREIYCCHWKAGLCRYLTVILQVTNSEIYLTIDETDHRSMKIYENTPENLKKAWAAKRGAVRNFKKKESRWTAPELVSETTKEEFN